MVISTSDMADVTVQNTNIYCFEFSAKLCHLKTTNMILYFVMKIIQGHIMYDNLLEYFETNV